MNIRTAIPIFLALFNMSCAFAVICPECKGTGKVEIICKACNGTGTTKINKTIRSHSQGIRWMGSYRETSKKNVVVDEACHACFKGLRHPGCKGPGVIYKTCPCCKGMKNISKRRHAEWMQLRSDTEK